MKALILLVIGLLAGAFCTAVVVNTLDRRGAHERAVMVVLARHVDALSAYRDDADCAGDEARRRLEQIAFAAREIDFAFARVADPAFARRNMHFRSVTDALPPQVASCAELDRFLAELDESCRACHRNFR